MPQDDSSDMVIERDVKLWEKVRSSFVSNRHIRMSLRLRVFSFHHGSSAVTVSTTGLCNIFPFSATG